MSEKADMCTNSHAVIVLIMVMHVIIRIVMTAAYRDQSASQSGTASVNSRFRKNTSLGHPKNLHTIRVRPNSYKNRKYLAFKKLLAREGISLRKVREMKKPRIEQRGSAHVATHVSQAYDPAPAGHDDAKEKAIILGFF